jgi:hypothetical protein
MCPVFGPVAGAFGLPVKEGVAVLSPKSPKDAAN